MFNKIVLGRAVASVYLLRLHRFGLLARIWGAILYHCRTEGGSGYQGSGIGLGRTSGPPAVGTGSGDMCPPTEARNPHFILHDSSGGRRRNAAVKPAGYRFDLVPVPSSISHLPLGLPLMT